MPYFSKMAVVGKAPWDGNGSKRRVRIGATFGPAKVVQNVVGAQTARAPSASTLHPVQRFNIWSTRGRILYLSVYVGTSRD